MSNNINLSGTWVGEYRQYDRPCAITAELRQSGEGLTGTMRDGEPDKEMPISEVTSGSEDEQIVARLREMFPDSPIAPIRYVSHLPPESILEGWVRGSGVYLLKSYRGVSFGGFRVGDQIVGQEIPEHSVHYSGRIGPGGDEIEGRWWIDPSPESGGRRTEGSFRLRRQSGETYEAEQTASAVVLERRS
jgi:hypothetical protein